jgi:hypothetical protein
MWPVAVTVLPIMIAVLAGFFVIGAVERSLLLRNSHVRS